MVMKMIYFKWNFWIHFFFFSNAYPLKMVQPQLHHIITLRQKKKKKLLIQQKANCCCHLLIFFFHLWNHGRSFLRTSSELERNNEGLMHNNKKKDEDKDAVRTFFTRDFSRMLLYDHQLTSLAIRFAISNVYTQMQCTHFLPVFSE